MKYVLSVILLVLIGTFLQSCEKSDPVTRGEYLVTVGGCNDCHTPINFDANGRAVPDKSRMLSGHPADLPHPKWTPNEMTAAATLAKCGPMMTAWSGPWGTSFAINLTPDQKTGLGEWTEEAFMKALRTGKHQGQPNGRDILPPMPWENHQHFTDEDLHAIWSYLRSIPAVENQVPLPKPPVTQLSAM